jgi:hypothetical protein
LKNNQNPREKEKIIGKKIISEKNPKKIKVSAGNIGS